MKSLGQIRIFAYLLASVVAVSSFVIMSDEAQAQSAKCSRLERQLASLNNSRPKRQSSRYRRAIKAQKKQIRILSRSMKERGCKNSGGFFSRLRDSKCNSMASNLDRMERNLAALQEKSSQTSGADQRTRDRQRSRLRRAIARNRCGEPEYRTTKRRRRSILEQIFGISPGERERRERYRQLAREQEGRDYERYQRFELENRLNDYDTVRTMCVRTCDGFYFPVSFSTTSDAMDRDGDACSQLCPGVHMELYYHRTSGETSEDMVSAIDGTPYSELPYAFSHRKKFNPSCTCNYKLAKANLYSSASGRLNFDDDFNLDPYEEDVFLEYLSKIPTPIWRPELAEDPETVANLKGRFDPRTVVALIKRKDERRVAASGKIRVVGESYFPVQ